MRRVLYEISFYAVWRAKPTACCRRRRRCTRGTRARNAARPVFLVCGGRQAAPARYDPFFAYRWEGGEGAKLSDQPQTRFRSRFPSRFYQARSQNISIRGLLIFRALISFSKIFYADHLTAKQLCDQTIFLSFFTPVHRHITPKFINSRLRFLLVFPLWRSRLAELKPFFNANHGAKIETVPNNYISSLGGARQWLWATVNSRAPFRLRACFFTVDSVRAAVNSSRRNLLK